MEEKSNGQLHPDHGLAEKILGPCPFNPGTENYTAWIKFALVIGTSRSTLVAELISRAETTSHVELDKLAVEYVSGLFEIEAKFCAFAVEHGLSVTDCEAALVATAEHLVSWYERTFGNRPRLCDPEVLRRIRLRLQQRVHHWKGVARRAALSILASTAAKSQQASVAVAASSSIVTQPQAIGVQRVPGKNQRFPKRAKWLQIEMSKQRLTRTRIRVLDGPDKATTARILRGDPVLDHVLDKLATALQLSRSQIPNE